LQILGSSPAIGRASVSTSSDKLEQTGRLSARRSAFRRASAAVRGLRAGAGPRIRAEPHLFHGLRRPDHFKLGILGLLQASSQGSAEERVVFNSAKA